jgi:hypothetical protein
MFFKNSNLYIYLKELSAEQKEYRDLARKFAQEEIIPKAAHYDKTGEVNNNCHESRFLSLLL